MKVRKSIVSGLVVLAMAFALVSSSAAGWFPFETPYPCGVASPAYPDYTDASPAPCAERDRDSSREFPGLVGITGVGW